MRTDCLLWIACPACGVEVALRSDECRPAVICPHCGNSIDIRDRFHELIALDAIAKYLDR